ncbi:MAG: hypothetical protein R3F14_21120 [Polyangiaceae bacterium]
MTKEAEDDPNFKLTRVTVEPTRTILDVTMYGGDKDSFTIHVAPVGQPNTLFLETTDGKKIPLVSSVGVAVDPAADTIMPGQSKSFSLIFGPLDPAVRKFHVFEGEAAKNPETKKNDELWAFRDVELK